MASGLPEYQSTSVRGHPVETALTLGIIRTIIPAKIIVIGYPARQGKKYKKPVFSYTGITDPVNSVLNSGKIIRRIFLVNYSKHI
jgi:hypothetical protein